MIDRLQSRPWHEDPRTVFRVVYGREPAVSDLALLAAAASELEKGNYGGAFRLIVNGYDHQVLPTAFTVRFSQDDFTFLEVGTFHLAIDKTDMSVSQPVMTGSYEPHLIEFYRDRLKPGMVFVDIGANIGLYSMLAAQIVGQTGRVLCFEPNSENCRLIMLSASKNGVKNIVVYPFALGNEIGHALFVTHIGSNGGLIPDTIDSLLNPSCSVIPLVRLDRVIQGKVDVIKIDVEGAEGLVIEGAKQIIEKYHPIVTSEFSLEMLPRVSRVSGLEYLQYFQKNHYNLYRVDRSTYQLVEIKDIDSFIHEYGDASRIEDLAFIPRQDS